MKKGQYIFWSYDQFPYLIGGEILAFYKVKGDLGGTYDYIDVKGYGSLWLNKSWVKYIKYIVSKKQGKLLQERLNHLEDSYISAKTNINDEFRKLRESLLAEFNLTEYSPPE